MIAFLTFGLVSRSCSRAVPFVLFATLSSFFFGTLLGDFSDESSNRLLASFQSSDEERLYPIRCGGVDQVE